MNFPGHEDEENTPKIIKQERRKKRALDYLQRKATVLSHEKLSSNLLKPLNIISSWLKWIPSQCQYPCQPLKYLLSSGPSQHPLSHSN